MSNSNELARIDRYTCKFENPVMEERFMAAKWERVKKPINFAVLFFSFLFATDSYNTFEMLGQFDLILLAYPVYILLFLFEHF